MRPIDLRYHITPLDILDKNTGVLSVALLSQEAVCPALAKNKFSKH